MTGPYRNGGTNCHHCPAREREAYELRAENRRLRLWMATTWAYAVAAGLASVAIGFGWL